MEEKEIWKQVEGYEGLYEVSSYGRVKTVPHYINGINLSEWRKSGALKFDKPMLIKEKILVPCMDAQGYLHYTLTKGHQNKKIYLAHRLVAKHFIPDFTDDMVVSHIDGDKFNNKVENLILKKRYEVFGKDIKYVRKLKCNQTGEIITRFKTWCKKNNVPYSRYYLMRHLRGLDKIYHRSGYTFEKIEE